MTIPAATTTPPNESGQLTLSYNCILAMKDFGPSNYQTKKGYRN
ncbi:protein of unknown function [Shewanella benthica]|uniref:Uncharacterized protein n=1 Tax=Shewanella benthica TaxID=43661 RepID=A0A330M5E5_9GAMM|nr:protein of unknown function [Shewanella benthica]